MYKYVCLSKGLRHRKLVLQHEIYNYVTDIDKDYYESVYFFNEDHLKHFEKTHSLAGITDVKGNRIIFDFDNHFDINEARQDALTLIGRFLQDNIDLDAIEIAFSGNKGFHITIYLTTFLTPAETKKIATYYAHDLKTFDTNVYDPVRIIRLLFTKHQKSGLFKIPLTYNELANLTIEQIKFKARDIEEFDGRVIKYINLTETMKKILNEQLIIPSAKKETLPISETLDLSRKPRWLTPAKFALQEGFFVEGERNAAFLILAATYKAQGFPKEITYRMLKGVAELQAKRNNTSRYPDEELWNNIVNVVYSPNWRGGVFSYENTPLLQTITERLNLPKENKEDEKILINISDVFNNFKRFAQDIDKNTIKLGIPEIDDEVRLTTSMLIGLLAAPSAGKTTIALNILNNVSKNDIYGVFFSLDMGAPLVFQRLLQKHTGLSSKEIFSIFRENNEERINKFVNTLDENYKNIFFSFKTALSVEDIRNYIIDLQNQLSIKINFICIDYLECLQSPYSDSTASSAYNAQKLKDLANELDLAILLLLQPQKHTGDPSSELISMRNVKGSSVIEQACSVIFTMWRPGFNPKSMALDRFLSIAVVKNRMGGLNVWEFGWNGLTGEIKELTEDDKKVLKLLKEQLEKDKYNDF
ncbi:MAG: DnaB-like helicase C-terminal domain-containing protein [Bacteroidia bacterium]|nr:DnaB-like helicase C-terminal domain-containing protein [Bacteroidia bacterium]